MTQRQAQLHELLAAETDTKNQTTAMHAETLAVFNKPDLFQGWVKTHVVTKPGVDELTKAAKEKAGGDVRQVTTTVDERLAYDAQFFIRRVDFAATKDLTNQHALADIIIDGKVVVQNVPATALLSLEQLLVEKRKQYQAAPTLPSGGIWSLDSQAAKPGIYKSANPETTLNTEKDFTFKVLAPATDKHPAQIEKWNVDVPVGKTEIIKSLGMWTSARKAEVLARCDAMILAVKEARARANQTPVKQMKIGAALLNFIEAKEQTA